MVQYLSLEEAAQILGISPERLKDMAERNEVRPFRDRGSMRFRSQEIEELARRMGKHSDPELQIGEIPPARAGDSPSRRQAKAGPEVFNFSLGDDAEKVDLGAEPRSPGSSKSKRGMSPAPKPGSDSDVRLVADGSDLDFQIAQDSKVRLVQDPEPTAKTGSGKRKGNPDAQGDSGVRILGPTVQSDSDVKILPPGPEDSDVILGLQPGKKASDSDIRLEHDKGGHSGSGLRRGKGAPDDSLVTEEINLDLDMPKEGKGDTGLSGLLKSKGKGKGGPADSQSKKPTSGKKTDSSSDFELTPASAKDQSPLELGSDEEVSLGELTGKAGDSGINLQDPADSGISLEQGSGEEALEFDLAPDASSTPKPGPIQKEDSDSEFELSMDDSSSEEHPKLKGEPDSDSEFELTLDDSGDLLPMEESGKKGGAAGEGDIFETDFEVPALEEDSGSQVAALDESDTDLENSEFDLALGDEDVAAEEESGSQVVALEEEAEAGAATVAKRRRAVALDDEDEEVGEDLAEDEVSEGRTRVVAAAPPTWGPLPAIVMIPCVAVMFLVTLMGLELVRGMWGYHQPTKVSGTLTRGLASMFDSDLPKE